jgi:hypothetical protein
MHIVTPTVIKSVAWEGEMDASQVVYSASKSIPPVVTIGTPEIWPVREALENQVGQKWVPPEGSANYWLVRLACTLREPRGWSNITEAQQTLHLRPKNLQADDKDTYAYSLFPERVNVEDKAEFNISLEPELKFGEAEFKAGEVGAKIEYRKVFPAIQSYGAGESDPYWIFKPHAARPLDGSQFVYAVVVARAGSDGIQANVFLTVTVETQLGRLRFGTPQEAKMHTKFMIP